MALQPIPAVLFVWQPTAHRGDGPLPTRGYNEDVIVDALFRLRSSMQEEMSGTGKSIKSMQFSGNAGSHKTYWLYLSTGFSGINQAYAQYRHTTRMNNNL
jgi:hypothetical protein